MEARGAQREGAQQVLRLCDATGCIQEGIDAGHIAQGRQEEAEGPVPCCLAVAGAHTHRCETLLRVYSLAYSSHL